MKSSVQIFKLLIEKIVLHLFKIFIGLILMHQGLFIQDMLIT